jgi:O-antigen/teichoic acid export membrane protein
MVHVRCTPKLKGYYRISLMSGVINVALGAIFIPLFGYVAAAPVFFVCMMYNGFYGHFASGLRNKLGADYLAMRWLLGILALTSAVNLMVELHWLLKIPVTIFGLGISAWWVWHLGKDLDAVQRMILPDES